jgi:hypothetical protein
VPPGSANSGVERASATRGRRHGAVAARDAQHLGLARNSLQDVVQLLPVLELRDAGARQPLPQRDGEILAELRAGAGIDDHGDTRAVGVRGLPATVFTRRHVVRPLRELRPHPAGQSGDAGADAPADEDVEGVMHADVHARGADRGGEQGERRSGGRELDRGAGGEGRGARGVP